MAPSVAESPASAEEDNRDSELSLMSLLGNLENPRLQEMRMLVQWVEAHERIFLLLNAIGPEASRPPAR